jgi:polar amino acid transport system substrate-binding protein
MRRTPLVVSLAVVALLATACGGDDDGSTTPSSSDTPSGSTSQTPSDQPADLGLISDGTITICSDLPYPPFEDEDSSKPSGYGGFDIDLMQAIADNLGLTITVQVTAFDAIQSGTAMVADQCDMAASAMTITDERKKNLGFSDPYYDSLQSLLAPDDSGIASIDDLAGKKVAVQTATTGQAYAQENAPDDAQIIEYPDDPSMWAALQAGQVDAILQDLPVNVEHAKEGGYSIVEQYQTDEQYGFAVKKEGKEALLEAINEQLQALRDDGKYDEIYDSYFATN